jgi:hypothetical protein
MLSLFQRPDTSFAFAPHNPFAIPASCKQRAIAEEKWLQQTPNQFNSIKNTEQYWITCSINPHKIVLGTGSSS